MARMDSTTPTSLFAARRARVAASLGAGGIAIVPNALERPRNRVALAEDADYAHCRRAVLDFLYSRHGPVEKAA
jgi:hypothetical protein